MNPYAGLSADSAGNLYGTTSAGGTADMGVVFKLDGTQQETVLHYFRGGADGAVPYAGVILDAPGNLYGTTYQGGAANLGVVYKLDASGRSTVLHSFLGGADGASPEAGVILDSAGNLYGTTSAGGSANAGVVFKVDATGQETVLYSFTGGADGDKPLAGLVLDPAGNLYGTTVAGGTFNWGVVFKLDAAGHETVLHSFTNGADGAEPYAGVTLGPDGKLYGTTGFGGRKGIDGFEGGVVFRLDATTGIETVLYSFPAGLDNYGPNSGVVLDPSGNLYGTAGAVDKQGGVVFKLESTGRYTVLHRFTTEAYPSSGVIRDPAGNLYGTTEPVNGGCGTGSSMYKLDVAGNYTLLHSFTGGSDGCQPQGGLIRDSAGNLYGTTRAGGTSNLGTVFKLDTTGQETVLSSFTSNGGPYTGMVLDSAGNLYGTTPSCVYKLDAAGNFTVLYYLPGGWENAVSGVVRDEAGNLYGTSYPIGSTGPGVLYKVDAAGNYTVPYSFTGGADGGYPSSGLILDPAGNLYGTTSAGGKGGNGVVFKLTLASTPD